MAVLVVLSTLLTASCGKNDSIKRNKVENLSSELEKFSTAFFYDCNLPYEKLHESDVQNSAEEYLFYIPTARCMIMPLLSWRGAIFERLMIKSAPITVGNCTKSLKMTNLIC